MGLSRGSLTFLMKEGQRRPLSGRVLTLGRQDIWMTWDELQAAADEIGAKLTQPETVELNAKPDFARRGQISERAALMAIGFTECESLDASDFEGADHVFDLNQPSVPDELAGRFDVVIDGGTLEHVFHLPNALANIHAMLREGGRAIHLVPSSNHLDHGFWMFSPTVFRDYYGANRYDLETLQVFQYRPSYDHREPWVVYEYGRDGFPFDADSVGGLDDSTYGVGCVATRTAESTSGVVPQQGAYVGAWAGGLQPGTVAAASPTLVQRIDQSRPALAASIRRLRPVRDAIKAIPRLRLAPRKRLSSKPAGKL
jgi:SAM-dependent methyltransferase